MDTVEPGLFGADDIILGVGAKRFVVRLAGDGVDTADRDFHRIRLPGGRVEAEPQRLSLVHRNKRPAMLAPKYWHAVEVILNLQDREPAKTGGQRIGAPIIGNAQRALEGDGKPLSDTDRFLIDGHIEHGLSPPTMDRSSAASIL